MKRYYIGHEKGTERFVYAEIEGEKGTVSLLTYKEGPYKNGRYQGGIWTVDEGPHEYPAADIPVKKLFKTNVRI
jgi:hypothetical protein